MAKSLLTGATDYIGVTVLEHLMRSEEPSINPLTIDVFIRDKKAAEVLLKVHGNRVRPILWTGFTDIPFVTATAGNYDNINAGTDEAKAFDAGLLPCEDTSKQKEIRHVEMEELAEEIMGGLVDMAERSRAGTQDHERNGGEDD